MSPYLEPRTFKLYDELEAAEHGVGDAMISLGLDDANDQTFTTWNASIFGGPGMGKFENRFFQMHITCGENYPVAPPVIKFTGQKVTLPCVDGSGNVNIGAVLNWNGAQHGMQDVVKAIKQSMIANRGTNQPAEGANY